MATYAVIGIFVSNVQSQMIVAIDLYTQEVIKGCKCEACMADQDGNIFGMRIAVANQIIEHDPSLKI